MLNLPWDAHHQLLHQNIQKNPTYDQENSVFYFQKLDL
jgi:hypothetical protein